MSWMKKILGLLCILIGTLPPHVWYARSGSGNLWDLKLYLAILVAAITSFLSFAICRLLLRIPLVRFVAGAIGSYFAMWILIFIISCFTGDSAELKMWWPIFMIFGIPYMAPLVVMSGLGSMLILSR